MARLAFPARIEEPHGPYDVISKLACYIFKGWGLIDLPLRASNEGSPRSRVARAQKIISLHPLLCVSYLLHYFIFKGSLVDPRLRASNEHIPIVRVPEQEDD